jgi:hypothetical protein
MSMRRYFITWMALAALTANAAWAQAPAKEAQRFRDQGFENAAR